MTRDESSADNPRNTTTTQTSSLDPEYQIIDLGKFARRLWSRRVFLLSCAIAGATIGGLPAFVIRPAYDATVRLMPPARKESPLLASLSPSRNEGDLYLGLVSSRTVADDVIQTLKLSDYFHTTKPSELRRRLERMAKIAVDKNQFITITVRAKEPEMAVKIANEFPLATDRLNKEIAISQASHRWDFYAGPLEIEKNKLAEAEEALKLAQQKTGIVLPEAQVQLGLSAIANLKQQITARQEQLAALSTSSTNQNPQVVQLKSQIASLSAQLAQLEAQNGGSARAASDAKTPELTLEVSRLARDVKFHEALFQILSRQYENAHVDDSYSPPVELVDKAVLPDEKSWPPRKEFALFGLLAGALLGLVLVCFRR